MSWIEQRVYGGTGIHGNMSKEDVIAEGYSLLLPRGLDLVSYQQTPTAEGHRQWCSENVLFHMLWYEGCTMKDSQIRCTLFLFPASHSTSTPQPIFGRCKSSFPQSDFSSRASGAAL